MERVASQTGMAPPRHREARTCWSGVYKGGMIFRNGIRALLGCGSDGTPVPVCGVAGKHVAFTGAEEDVVLRVPGVTWCPRCCPARRCAGWREALSSLFLRDKHGPGAPREIEGPSTRRPRRRGPRVPRRRRPAPASPACQAASAGSSWTKDSWTRTRVSCAGASDARSPSAGRAASPARPGASMPAGASKKKIPSAVARIGGLVFSSSPSERPSGSLRYRGVAEGLRTMCTGDDFGGNYGRASRGLSGRPWARPGTCSGSASRSCSWARWRRVSAGMARSSSRRSALSVSAHSSGWSACPTTSMSAQRARTSAHPLHLARSGRHRVVPRIVGVGQPNGSATRSTSSATGSAQRRVAGRGPPCGAEPSGRLAWQTQGCRGGSGKGYPSWQECWSMRGPSAQSSVGPWPWTAAAWCGRARASSCLPSASFPAITFVAVTISPSGVCPARGRSGSGTRSGPSRTSPTRTWRCSISGVRVLGFLGG